MNIIDRKLQEIAMTEAANKDCLVARFLLESGLKAYEVELVSEQTATGYKFYVRKREES